MISEKTMKYLSVDLEACNMFVRGSVFSVGMVLADENFNIIFKRNYWINPLCRFVMKFRKPIDFGVTKADLEDKPTFADVRDEIAAYLEDKDTIVMAHSANNDMFMFNEACRRARVKPFAFRFICTQMIYSAVYDVENGVGLDKVSVELGRTSEFTHHQADDDAEMALYLLQYCMEQKGLTYQELIKRYGITPGRMKDGSFTPMRCAELGRLRTRRRQRAFALQRRWQKEVKKGEGITMHIDPRFFELMKGGSKTIELRLLDEKRSGIKVGDLVYFIKSSHVALILKTRITAIEEFDSFESAYEILDHRAIGFRDVTLLDYLEKMYALYPEGTDFSRKVVAFHLEVCEE